LGIDRGKARAMAHAPSLSTRPGLRALPLTEPPLSVFRNAQSQVATGISMISVARRQHVLAEITLSGDPGIGSDRRPSDSRYTKHKPDKEKRAQPHLSGVRRRVEPGDLRRHDRRQA
jgi:hypothetical protein